MKTLTTHAPRLSAGILIVCSALLAGCSSGTSSVATGPTNTVRGLTTQDSATASAPITVPTSGGVTQTLKVGGASETVVVPSGVAASVPAGATLAVVQSGSTLLSGAYTGGAPISINGVSDSGLTVNIGGGITQNVALPIDAAQGTDYAIGLPQGDVQTRALTIGKTTFSGRFYVRNGAIVSPLPLGVNGKIPNNGENAAGSQVTATFGAGNDGRTAHLTVDYGNGFVLDQTQTIKSSKAAFQNFATDASSVPANGISTLSLVVGP
jgi:hypothetical protein